MAKRKAVSPLDERGNTKTEQPTLEILNPSAVDVKEKSEAEYAQDKDKLIRRMCGDLPHITEQSSEYRAAAALLEYCRGQRREMRALPSRHSLYGNTLGALYELAKLSDLASQHCYFTVNELPPERNKSATKDCVSRRRFLPIDIDPERVAPFKGSACCTDAEKRDAEDVFEATKKALVQALGESV
jgi:hypothetical protein